MVAVFFVYEVAAVESRVFGDLEFTPARVVAIILFGEVKSKGKRTLPNTWSLNKLLIIFRRNNSFVDPGPGCLVGVNRAIVRDRTFVVHLKIKGIGIGFPTEFYGGGGGGRGKGGRLLLSCRGHA